MFDAMNTADQKRIQEEISLGLKRQCILPFPFTKAHLVIREIGVVVKDTECMSTQGMPSPGFISCQHVIFATNLHPEPVSHQPQEGKDVFSKCFISVRTVEIDANNV